MIGFIVGVLYFVFVVSCLLLLVIILLQEGKGGGLAGAFGGAGTEAFGVKAGGINRFTATLAGIFLMSAISVGMLQSCTESSRKITRPPETTAVPGTTTGSSSVEVKTSPPTTPDGSAPAGAASTSPAAGDKKDAGTATPTPPSDGGEKKPAEEKK